MGRRTHNVNVPFVRKVNNDNDIVTTNNAWSIKRADRIADRLVDRLKAPECRPFFCKCAYALSENDIESILEAATRPEIRTPKKYFTRTAKVIIATHCS